MNGFKQYITSFFSGLRSLLVGMRTTLRVFFRKKTTEQYPENRDTLKMFDRFRGQLVMKHNDRNEHRCVACGICQSCLYCQLCVRSCPHDAIEFDTAFEHAVFTRGKLVRQLNSEGSTLEKK